MRITKEFSRHCASVAMSDAQKAVKAGNLMLYKYLTEETQRTKILNFLFPQEIRDAVILYDKQCAALYQAVKNLSVTPEGIRNRLLSDLEPKGKRQDLFYHNTTTNSDEHPDLSLSLRLYDDEGAPLTRTVVQTYELFNNAPDSTYQVTTPYISSLYTRYSYSRSATKAELNVNEVLGIESRDKLLHLVTTSEKLANLQKNIKDQEYKVEDYTTLAHMQANQYIWPLAKKNEWVVNWIAGKERDIQQAKEEKEEKLKQRREEQAEERKRQLARIKSGEVIAAPVDDTVDTSLITAINTFDKMNRGY